ncbi:MAG TPA: PLP-dependent aminotransferase family protein [Alphaproteobacteria bacterium]|nr:PLP-dependent aminotransferase family protein [Alphaproteobacteria bacterium]
MTTFPSVALLSLSLRRDDREPLARQLYLQLRDLILTGRIAAGARLPSTRTLAHDLQVSRIVPLAAYDQLSAEGYVASRRGSGIYVEHLGSRITPQGSAHRPRPSKPVAAGGGPSRDAPFSLGSQDVDAFPHADWARLLARGWRRRSAGSLDDPAGLPELRAAIASYVHMLRGVPCATEQVIVTSGNYESLQLIARLLPRGRRTAWVEDPGYLAAHRALKGAGVRLAPIPVDDQGLQVEAGKARAANAGLALVTPAREFPIGSPMSLPRRLALLDWAREADALLVEDDYDSEMRFSGKPLASLTSLEPARVLALDSFSKLTFPGLRLGSIVGPAPVIARLVALRGMQPNQTATVAQPALAEFIETGGMARHLRFVRQRAMGRRRLLMTALEERLGAWLTVKAQDVGRHLLATPAPRLAERTSDGALAKRAAEAGLRIAPLSAFFVEAPPRQGLLFGFGAWDEAEILRGVERLAEVIEPDRD